MSCWMLQGLCDWDPLRMPSVRALTDAASNWIKIRDNARAELRLGADVPRRRDKDVIIEDLTCVEQQLTTSQHKVNKVLADECLRNLRPHRGAIRQRKISSAAE